MGGNLGTLVEEIDLHVGVSGIKSFDYNSIINNLVNGDSLKKEREVFKIIFQLAVHFEKLTPSFTNFPYSKGVYRCLYYLKRILYHTRDVAGVGIYICDPGYNPQHHTYKKN